MEKKIRIAAAGDNCVDVYSDGNVYPGGNPVNVAVYVARLGGESAYIGAVGTDKYGKIMLDAIEADMQGRFRDQPVHLHAAYTCSREEALSWKQEIATRFPGYEIDMDPLSLSVACHIGPGSLAVTCTKKLCE